MFWPDSNNCFLIKLHDCSPFRSKSIHEYPFPVSHEPHWRRFLLSASFQLEEFALLINSVKEKSEKSFRGSSVFVYTVNEGCFDYVLNFHSSACKAFIACHKPWQSSEVHICRRTTTLTKHFERRVVARSIAHRIESENQLIWIIFKSVVIAWLLLVFGALYAIYGLWHTQRNDTKNRFAVDLCY